MKSILRVGVSVAFAVLLLAGLIYVRAPGLAAIGLDLWTVEERNEVERQRSERLAVRTRELLAHNHSKMTIAQALVEGKLTVTEALVSMKAICDVEPDAWQLLRRVEPRQTDEECLSAHLLDWVYSVHQEAPAQSGTAIARLKKELRREAKHHSTPVPDPRS